MTCEKTLYFVELQVKLGQVRVTCNHEFWQSFQLIIKVFSSVMIINNGLVNEALVEKCSIANFVDFPF